MMFIGRSPEERAFAAEVGGNDSLVVARDRHGRAQLFRRGDSEMEHAGLDLGEAMPFRDYPGVPAPPDKIRDGAIIAKLRERGKGLLPKRGQILDYDQSKALFETANGYFEQDHPLMNTERWLAGYVENNDITYTDHDGRRYKMKGGQRYPVSAAPGPVPMPGFEEDLDADDDDDGFFLV